MAAETLTAVSGDWDASGFDSVALYDRAVGRFYLRNENNPGFPNAALEFGASNSNQIPIAGDWDGDGTDSVGLYDPLTGIFSLKTNNRSDAADVRFQFTAAGPGGLPVAGDWDGDGRDSVGVYDPTSGRFHLKNDLQPGAADQVFEFWPSDVNGKSFAEHELTDGGFAIAGDWDGDGRDTVGLYNSASGQFYLKNNLLPNRVDQVWTFDRGGHGDTPLTGDFDGDGVDSLGIYDSQSAIATLKNTLWPGAADSAFYVVPSPNIVSASAARLILGAAATVAPAQETTLSLLPRFGPDSRLASADNPWHNTVIAGDVDGNGSVAKMDALLVIVALRTGGSRSLPMAAATAEASFYLDVNGDGQLSPTDALIIISGLRTSSVTSRVSAATATTDGGLVVADTGSVVADAGSVVADAGSVSHSRASAAAATRDGGAANPPAGEAGPAAVLAAADVETLLARAAAASASEDAIIAIVDRGGRILGVRVEAGVLATITDEDTLVFAIDGAVAKARTAAFFANGDGSGGVGPLTSRTIRFISQSTVTQREVQSNPNIKDTGSTMRGPGFVAPIGLGGHFPPGVQHTPPVDLFGIEHQSRDSIVHPGADSVKGLNPITGIDDDILLPSRFNVDPAFVPMGQEMEAPESYGFTSKRMPDAQSRGIATLPGGLPVYNSGVLVGGIGVFFPGPDGYATHEQGFIPGVGQRELDRTNAPRVLESEWIAYAALGGSSGAAASVGMTTIIDALDGIPRDPRFNLPFGRIDLVGITLEIYGPHPTQARPRPGVATLIDTGARVGRGSSASGANQVVDPGPDMDPGTVGDNLLVRDGERVPDGWLVLPHAGGGLSAEEVERIINQGIAEANLVRAAIRLDANGRPGSRTRMVFAVADPDGIVLGLFRMPDATVFSIDVAVAKARNTAYYADPAAILDVDRVDDNGDGLADASVPAGAALTNRTFRFLAEPRFPSGVEGSRPGAFSILLDAGINPATAENIGPPAPASVFSSVLGFDAFNPGRNFRDPDNIANQNGIVFFPGSTPLYKPGPAGGSVLVGGFGVSGDGVDQDDVVTFSGSVGFQTPTALRADQFFVRGVRLPFQKFNRNPRG